MSVLVLMFRFHTVLAEKCCLHHRDETVECDLLSVLCALLTVVIWSLQLVRGAERCTG